MNKSIFYYSEKKLKYIEIKNFYPKFLSLVGLFAIIFGFIFLFGYIFFMDLIHSELSVSNLKNENKLLKEKFIEMSSQITELNSQIENLNTKDDALRLSVNLEPLSEEEKNFGIGGYEFRELDLSSVSDISEVVAEVDNSLDVLNTKFIVTKNNYDEIEKSLNDNLQIFKSLPAVLPANGPIGDRFGMRLHPILRVRRMHTGIDIKVNTGTEVYAPGDGKVTKVNYRSGYGRTIEIDHGFGYTSLYAHLSKTKVKRGAKVKRGDLIGISGNTGSFATGPHLHYEVKHNGVHLNPKNFIFADVKIFDLIKELRAQEQH